MHNIKKGLIIIFCDDEKNINKKLFKNFFKHQDVKLCFVNNGSKDNTLDLLEAAKNEATTNISVVDIKKNKGTVAAVKAGARFLFSTENLKCILYLKSDMLSYVSDLKKQLEILNKIDYTIKNKSTVKKNNKILQKVISFDDFLLL